MLRLVRSHMPFFVGLVCLDRVTGDRSVVSQRDQLLHVIDSLISRFFRVHGFASIVTVRVDDALVFVNSGEFCLDLPIPAAIPHLR